MRKQIGFGVAAILALVLAGCGGGGAGRTVVVFDILSAGGTLDGDITLDSVTQTYSPFFSSDPPNTVLVGEDPIVAGVDSRGFITFPITTIPSRATILSATVFLPILRVDLISPPSVSLLVDMVVFPPLDSLLTQIALANVYDTPPILLGPSIEVRPGDAGSDRLFDATDPLIEARSRGFADLQFRLIGSFGQVVIDDLDPGGLTPLLRVEYEE